MNNKELKTKKWELIHANKEKEYTCYYSPNEKHSLCPHPEKCILNKEFMDTISEIQHNKQQIKHLKTIYNIAIDHYKKHNEAIVYGFKPKKNTLQRMILKNKNKKNYQKLKELKTKKGGYT